MTSTSWYPQRFIAPPLRTPVQVSATVHRPAASYPGTSGGTGVPGYPGMHMHTGTIVSECTVHQVQLYPIQNCICQMELQKKNYCRTLECSIISIQSYAQTIVHNTCIISATVRIYYYYYYYINTNCITSVLKNDRGMQIVPVSSTCTYPSTIVNHHCIMRTPPLLPI